MKYISMIYYNLAPSIQVTSDHIHVSNTTREIIENHKMLTYTYIHNIYNSNRDGNLGIKRDQSGREFHACICL